MTMKRVDLIAVLWMLLAFVAVVVVAYLVWPL
jgi:cbb3-type cytochrome oxidase subunit 3